MKKNFNIVLRKIILVRFKDTKLNWEWKSIVSKGQQLDQSIQISRKQPMGLQRQRKNPASGGGPHVIQIPDVYLQNGRKIFSNDFY